MLPCFPLLTRGVVCAVLFQRSYFLSPIAFLKICPFKLYCQSNYVRVRSGSAHVSYCKPYYFTCATINILMISAQIGETPGIVRDLSESVENLKNLAVSCYWLLCMLSQYCYGM